jgi:SAM-dependent methyltransferase
MNDLQRWEERYAADGYLFGTEPNAFLVSQAPLLRPGQKALAVADGEGRNGVWLAGRGLDVTSIELSPTAIAKAEELARSRNVRVTLLEADLFTWTWPDQAFDVVVAIFIQFAPPEARDRIFAGMKRALRPGGYVVLQGYRPEQLQYRTGGPSELDRFYTRTLLEQTFGDFEDVSIREYDDEVQEGTAHVGRSALIELVARKPG